MLPRYRARQLRGISALPSVNSVWRVPESIRDQTLLRGTDNLVATSSGVSCLFFRSFCSAFTLRILALDSFYSPFILIVLVVFFVPAFCQSSVVKTLFLMQLMEMPVEVVVRVEGKTRLQFSIPSGDVDDCLSRIEGVARHLEKPLKIGEISQRLGVSKSTVRRLIDEKKLKGKKRGAHRQVTLRDLEKYEKKL